MSNQNKNVSTSANINNNKNSNKKENQTMKNITKLTSNQRQDSVIDVINEMNKRNNISLGIAEIEFPDGSKEKYYYNGEEDRQAAIDDLTFAINAAIKVWTSDDMRTDLDYINAPYYENGDVIDIGIYISKNEDYDKLAEDFLEEYEKIKDLEIRDDGLIISSKPLKTFYISVTETLKKTVEVRAEDKYEAIQKVSDAYHDEQIVLDSDDYVDVDFDDVTDDTIYNYELGGMPKFYEVQ